MGGPAFHHVRKAQHLYQTMGGLACHHVRKAQHLYPTMGGLACHHVEGLTDSSLPLGRNLDLENTKILHEVLKLHFGHFWHIITSGLTTSKDNL